MNHLDYSSIKKAALGAAFLAPLVILYFSTTATIRNAWFFGHEFHIGCWVKNHLGFPCPVCGMTRSVILTIHGDLGTALLANVGGPLLVSATVLFGLAMLFVAAFETGKSDKLVKWVFYSTGLYLGIALVISLTFWIFRLAGSYPSI